MYRAFSSARQSYVYDSDEDRFVEYSKPGSWVYNGEGEKIYCEHKLISKIQRPKIRRHRVLETRPFDLQRREIRRQKRGQGMENVRTHIQRPQPPTNEHFNSYTEHESKSRSRR